MNMKKILSAIASAVFTLVFILALMYVEVKYTHGIIIFTACNIAIIGALFIFFYAMLNDW